MPVDFRDNFWGEANNGFEVLYRNMKNGHITTKDLAEFIKERSIIEETNSKLLAKLAKHASNCCSQGTFGPLWQILRSSTETLSSLHSKMVESFQELVKDVIKYSEDQHRRHKLCKEEESGTSETVQSMQQTTLSLQKAKEAFNARTLEYERLKRENVSPRELEKAEMKCKKACDEYRLYIEKYSTIRNDFEKKMTITCGNFQNIEEEHIRQLKIFLSKYAQVLRHGHDEIGKVHVKFSQQCNEIDVDKLLEQVINNRGTGTERPCAVSFEEADLSPLNQTLSPDISEQRAEEKTNKKEGNYESSEGKVSAASNHNNDSANNTPPLNSNVLTRTQIRASKYWHVYWNSWSSSGVQRFLKSKREKRKEKKKKKVNGTKEDTSVTSNEIESLENCQNLSPLVDDEGFTIRPQERNQGYDKDNFYSSSDESEEEEKERKIHIEIKPVSNSAGISASIDELRATIGTFSLSPDPQRTTNRPGSSAASTPDEGPLKRSMSMTNPLNKPDTDVFSLFSPSASSASTPTGAPVGGFPSPPNTSSPNASSASEASQNVIPKINTTIEPPPAESDLDMFSNAIQKLAPSSRGGTPTGSIIPPVLPRPASRRALENSRGRMSPSPFTMTRTESIGSLTSDFKTTSMPVGSSRGPSPLTIGMCDTIPLAVAFNEVVNACFRGTDETKCQVRLMGDMKVSFPAGIVQVLANNPSPALLSFRITKAGKLENILPNKQLICIDTSQKKGEQIVYEFNMPALTSLLRKQYEQTPTASYFNIDILKYHIKALPGAKSTPLHLVAYWKCESLSTDLRIDYKYNPTALSSLVPLTSTNIIVPVNGGVSDVQSKPKALWNTELNRAVWKIPELSHSLEGGLGSLRAHFDLSSGPTAPSALAAQFICSGTSLSGAEFELCGLGYRLSLVKKQVIAGKYLCESDQMTYV